MSKLSKTWKQYWPLLTVLLIVGIALFVRLYNLPERLYFIYDQGRDALKLREILSGDLTLVGPTSGLAGFFLGPLWYYAGVPGFILSQGNPYGLSLWYISLSLLALPGFWLISRQLFDRPWDLISFALLSLIPGSIIGSIFIWNPLLSVPMMTYAYWALTQARHSRWHLALGFFLIALTLQSEFAYAVFFIPVLVLLIPWLRQRLDWRDFLVSGLAGAITLLPQAAFEIKNNFLLTNSLLSGVLAGEGGLTLWQLWQFRPIQLWNATSALLLGYPEYHHWLMIPLALSLVLAIVLVLRKLTWKKLLHPQPQLQSELLLVLFFGLPYLGYLFWTGNQGNFFDYYITSHFIFVVLLLVLGWQYLWQWPTQKWLRLPSRLLVLVSLIVMSLAWIKYINDFALYPINNAGLQSMDRAVSQLFSWRTQADLDNSTMLVFTPGYQNEQYDYLIYWKARAADIPQPHSTRQGDETNWFLLMEKNDSDISEFRFEEWYPVATAGGQLVEKTKIGILELEWWQATKSAQTPNE